MVEGEEEDRENYGMNIKERTGCIISTVVYVAEARERWHPLWHPCNPQMGLWDEI